MDFLNERLPKHLSPRLWLITIPSAVVTFDRRSGVPQLPAAPSRIVGALFLAGGVALAVISQQKPEATIAYEGPLAPVARRPAILAGLAALIGVAFLLRSTLLVLYTIALAIAGGTERTTLEEPNAKNILGMYDE
jgi:protein-S-isoprenylcysteine O-methyltransferase Ste14